jgi:hypothetical protein
VTIAGTHFGATAAENVVRFGGKPGRVVQASPTRLEVEIPEMRRRSGRDTPVPVVVVVDGHESKAATVRVFEAPRIHGISPAVAMPGDEVVLAGAGWGAGVTVQFGSTAATVLDTTPSSLKVTVPALEGRRARSSRCAWPRAPTPPTPRLSSSAASPRDLGLARERGPGDLVTVAGAGSTSSRSPTTCAWVARARW